MTIKKSANKSYDVGHGKPPVHTRFQKGKSGNPDGRRKAQAVPKSIERILRDTAYKPVKVTIDGKQEQVAMYEAIVLRTAQAALAGDPRATKLFLEYVAKHVDLTPSLAQLMNGRPVLEFTAEDCERFDKARLMEGMSPDMLRGESKSGADVDRATGDDREDDGGQPIL